MARANRHFLPGQIWHITHRCHKRAFLLKFARDRRRYEQWLFEARKRFGLSILNYVVTSNHVHLLLKDTFPGVIAQSMQLIAGRAGQEYNQRKGRQGAFWEDRYHATAVEAGEHLHRCLVYIDLNMVRAGVVRHPAEWVHGGYLEIQNPPKRYKVIDMESLCTSCGFSNVVDFKRAHRRWVEAALIAGPGNREAYWSSQVAIGSPAFVGRIRRELKIPGRYGHADIARPADALREARSLYTADFGVKNSVLRQKIAIIFGNSAARTGACDGPTPRL